MVKRALSIFKPTAKDSILAPAVPVPQSSLSGSWEIDSYRPNRFVIRHLLCSQQVSRTSSGKDSGHPIYDTRLIGHEG